MDADLIEVLVYVFFLVVVPLFRALFGKKQPEAQVPPPEPYPEVEPAPYPGRDLSLPEPIAATTGDEARARLIDRLAALEQQADELADATRASRATYRFSAALDEHVTQRARALRAELERGEGAPPVDAVLATRDLEIVLEQLSVFIEQRRNPALLPKVGDADTLAIQCYQPAMQFAHARGIPLTSSVPVAELGHYDLATWTAFIPTGFAPIFLPRDFFERAAWWPAIAHEIAHDFLASADGVEAQLREQLALPPEHVGARPLSFSDGGLTMFELRRVYGAWFEEIFADVFGVLMMGPAYAWTMVELFAAPQDPMSVVRVRVDPYGRGYDVHPPRHLRVVIAARMLERVGQEDDAERVRQAWLARHGGGEPDRILFPIGGQLVGVPIEPLERIAVELADRLYGEQLQALHGFRLADVPGVDFGPAQNAECERVAAALLAGTAPRTLDARAVVSGLVLATRREPLREAEFLRLARTAIEAHGSTETRPDAYAPGRHRVSPVRGGRAAELREAFLLHTILAPSPAMRRMGLGPRRSGVVSRPSS